MMVGDERYIMNCRCGARKKGEQLVFLIIHQCHSRLFTIEGVVVV